MRRKINVKDNFPCAERCQGTNFTGRRKRKGLSRIMAASNFSRLKMAKLSYTILFFTCFLSLVAAQMRRKEVHEYGDCKRSYQKPVGVQDGRIPNGAMTASSSNAKRPPSNARVGRSASAWSPSIQNAMQWLQIDLGSFMTVTAVYTQGRQGSDEYVREFFLEYSEDAGTWRRYTNELGIPLMFEGNKNDSALQIRTLTYPIVARYIRFNPQRWNMVISMRVEIVGCPFEPETASFDGKSFIEYDMSRQSVQTTQDLIELRFKTGRPDGIIMYASGNQGDIIMLEMRRGYLYVKIDLGSTAEVKGLTEVKSGSLLDDNQWHDVVITRDKKDMRVIVDRLMNEVTTKGEFYRLDLDKKMFIGGVPFFNQEGISIKYNFIGCVQNVKLNGAKLIRDALSGTVPSISLVNQVNRVCNVKSKVPVTFPTLESYIMVTSTTGNVVNVDFEFRTYDTDGLLFYHQMGTEAYVKVIIDRDGHVKYTVQTEEDDSIEDVVRNTDVLSETDAFTDGLWHAFYFYMDGDKINCTVDRNSKVSQRKLKLTEQSDFYIGGHELYNGFRGCLRSLYVAQRIVDLNKLLVNNVGRVVSATIGTCGIRDRCTPNPCEHGGVCHQSWSTFTCNCENTGYEGELCHTSSAHISCEMHKYYSNNDGRETATIDPDGSGPLKPFQVLCEWGNDGEIVTYVAHDSLGAFLVNGFDAPGSYVRKIQYATTELLALEEIIDRSRMCRQNVKYRCMNAKFLKNPGDLQDKTIRTYGWWVGRTHQIMRYWGGAAPGSGKCACGLQEEGCGAQSNTCYCDIVNSLGELGTAANIDQGYLEHKEYLPVLELHLGDTGTTTDNKWAEHDIGYLECYGDNLFDNTVTFTQKSGALTFPTFDAQNAGDIWLQFRTTTTDGVLIHCTGDTDFVEIRLFQADTIQFRYDVGNGVSVLSFKSPSPLNDDTWHTIHVEKNRKQAWLKLDDYTGTVLNEDADLIRQLDLTEALYVGSLVGYQDGYVGCIRGLRVNGRLMDMLGKVTQQEQFGVRAGCVGKCASNPCFHQGTCREGYDSYKCDCSYTPWRGWNCGREVGVNLKQSNMIKYTFNKNSQNGLSASDFQRATVGFTTRTPQGILIQMTNADNTEYIQVEVNNNGGIRVALNTDGENREEVNSDEEVKINLANRQTHVVVIERSNSGTEIKVQIDNYPPLKKKLLILSASSDTILDDPKYLYIGNNSTDNKNFGFEGCIFQMQVDNIFPLKRAFQDPKPDFVELIPADEIKEDMCGFEEITVPPEPIKTRPNTGVLLNVTYTRIIDDALSDEEKALVGIGCALFVILVACIVLFCCRSRFEGADYETEEAKGAEYADNPDSAVVYNQTGLPNMPKSYEYFM